MLQRLPALYVAAFAWAAGTVAGEVLPLGLFARVVLVAAVVVALYAGTAAFVIFVACGRFGIVRAPRWRRQVGTIAVLGSFAWILIGAWHEGRTALNLGAVAAAELAGISLYLGRRSVLVAVKRRVDLEP